MRWGWGLGALAAETWGLQCYSKVFFLGGGGAGEAVVAGYLAADEVGMGEEDGRPWGLG